MGEHEEELLEALQGMARQHLSNADSGIMTHDFWIAGENCLNVLAKFDKVSTSDGIHYTWIGEEKWF